MLHKHTLSLALVVVLALSGLGMLNAQAQDDDTAPAWLGVAIANTADGVQIQGLADGSPAEDAGLQVGDIITAVDATAITDSDALVALVAGHAPGDEIAISVLRDGEELSLPVTLAERPDDVEYTQEFSMPEFNMAPGQHGRLLFLGLNLELTDEGLLVKSLEDGSALADAGLQADDVITAINGEAVADLGPRELMLALRNSEELTLTVQRGDEEIEVTLTLADLGNSMFFGMPNTDTITVQPMQLGVLYLMLDEASAAERELDVTEGALIEEVYDDTPAADAGLQLGDIVTAVDGDVVDAEHTLSDRLYAYEEGDVVTLTVLRDGEEIDLSVELGPRNNMSGWMDSGDWGMLPGMRGNTRFFGHGFDENFLEAHPFMGDLMDEMHDGIPFFFDLTPDNGAGAEQDAAVEDLNA